MDEKVTFLLYSDNNTREEVRTNGLTITEDSNPSPKKNSQKINSNF